MSISYILTSRKRLETLEKQIQAQAIAIAALTDTLYQLTARNQTVDFLENKWVPKYLEKFIEKGNLVKRATNPDPKAVLTGVQHWAQVAMEQIESKKKQLIDLHCLTTNDTILSTQN